MNPDIIGAIVAAIAGFLIAFINYTFSKRVIMKAPDKFLLTATARQVLQILFLVIVYFIGTKTELANVIYLLVGAVLGMTLPMIYFTRKLLSLNKSTGTKNEDKEVKTDG